LRSNRLYLKHLSTDSEGATTKQENWTSPVEQDSASPDNANIITSVVAEVGDTTYHNVLLDLDVEHHYVKSSTDGHGHLYINVVLETHEYREVLQVLKKYGILGEGTAAQLDRDGMTSLRLPGLTKGINDGSEDCKYCKQGTAHTKF
jgi:hypothetical protein